MCLKWAPGQASSGHNGAEPLAALLGEGEKERKTGGGSAVLDLAVLACPFSH